MKIVSNLRPNFSLSEGHVLVRGEESHEFWHSVNSDLTGSVDIEMSPGLGPVGAQVGIGGSSSESLVGSKNLDGGGFGLGLGHGEDTGWLSSLNSGLLVLLGLLLSGVLLKHGSHEKVIGVGRESIWDLSLVSSFTLISWDELDVGLFFRLIIRGSRVGVELDVGSHWWSGVGSGGSNITEIVLENLFISVGEN